MSAVLQEYDPLVSEFESREHEESYNAWLRAKVDKSISDPRPRIPHDVVMAEMRALLDRKN
jgi:hypothetical protein